MGIFNKFRKKGSSKENAGKIFDAAEIIGVPSEADLRGFRMGVQYTVIMGIRCGGCGKEWKDAFTPDQETSVTCPFCGGTNKATVLTPSEESGSIIATSSISVGPKEKTVNGIQILEELVTGRGILFESDYVQRAVEALDKEGAEGSRKVAGLIQDLFVCRSPKLKSVLDVAGELEPTQELIQAVLELKNAKELAPVPVDYKYTAEIVGDNKVGWTSGTAHNIRQKSIKVLEKLTGAVVEPASVARPGADLAEGDFEGADWDSADLTGANLKEANLEDAILRHATLINVNLEGANLKGANLYFANLKGANLKNANLRDTNLYMSVMTDAQLEGADVTGAYVEGAVTLPNGHRGGLSELKKFTLGEPQDSE
jgi:hypothetical protein